MQVGKPLAQCRARFDRQLQRAVAPREAQSGAVGKYDFGHALLEQHPARRSLQFTQRPAKILAQWSQPAAFADRLDRGQADTVR